jgi:nucleoside-diphosphate kinase
MLQRTLILLKPDAVSKRVCGAVISRFEEMGLLIRGCKMAHLTPSVLREHYAHIADKPFYPQVEEFMASIPVIALVLEGDSCIEKVRDVLGVTDSRKAAPGTIRNKYGVDVMINIAHASDSAETAAKEVKRFFRDDELFSYEPLPEDKMTSGR